MGGLNAAVFLLICQLQQLVIAGNLSNDFEFEVTRFFRASSNSTCGGDPPTIFVYNGQEFNCSVGDHPADFSLDSSLSTWWQSSNSDDPVSILFSLTKPALSLVVTSIQIMNRHSVPSLYLVEIRSKNSNNTQQMAYVQSLSLCENLTVPCLLFEVNSNVINLVLNISYDEPVAAILLILSGNSMSNFDPRLNYFALVEVTILAQIADGFYARSLDGIRIEGESGVIQATSQPVRQAADMSLFPGFTGRGFASLNYSQSEMVTVQWILSSLPTSTRYQIAFVYSSHDHRNRRRPVTIMQEEFSANARVTFLADCLKCMAYLSDSDQLSEPANFTLTQSMITITASLSAIDVSLDAIVAVPQQFYNPSSLDDPVRFLSTCNITSGNFLDAFCHKSALQLSVEFFCSTYDCSCFSRNLSCQSYGGQCECTPALMNLSTPIGRQCELCPFYSYHTISGCNACTCPDPFDDCNLETGECSGCDPLTFGNACENCIPNSYRNDNDTCTPCNCDFVGSVSCNQTSGQCVCREGVTGELCNQCASTHFNFTSFGCTSCNCGLGSVNGSCNDFGQCYCEVGVSGSKCTTCLNGFYSLSSQGCLPCFCSNVTNQCSSIQDSSFLQPQEICECPFPFTGLSCESCVEEYYYSNFSGLCEPCNCGGRASICADGDGMCINCTGNSTGLNCELCVEGTYDADISSEVSCQDCPCSIVTSFNTSCTTDINGQPSCYCLPGHQAPLCNMCSTGYFGSPPSNRCTDCNCNGNIDPNIPGSCDTITGQCIICTNNATGPECELCQLGYYGDATMQTCQPCDCYDGGSMDLLCDRSSGQCSCLDGVGGLSCNQCQDGYFNFTDGKGCQQCQCSMASANPILCDQLTGQCSCLEGVGGLDCSSCLDTYFNLTAGGGCSECNCGLGASDGRCSDDGACFCLPGVTGTKCNDCLNFHFSLSSAGCQQCGGCEQMLIVQFFIVENIITSIGLNFSLFDVLMSVDLTGDIEINSALRNQMLKRFNLHSSLTSIDIYLTMLTEMALESVDKCLLATTEQIWEVLERSILIQPNAITVRDHILDVHRAMQDVFASAGNIHLFVASINDIISTQASTSIERAENTSMLKSQSLTNTGYLLRENTFLLREAKNSVNSLTEFTRQHINQSNMLSTKYQTIEFANMQPQLSTLFSYIYNLCARIDGMSYLDTVPVSNSILMAKNSLSQEELTIACAQSLFILSKSDVDTLMQVLGTMIENQEISGSGEFVSGSGMTPGNFFPSFSESQLLCDRLISLQLNLDQLLRQYMLQAENIRTFDGIATLVGASQNLNSTLASVVELGNLGVLINYASVIEELADITNISYDTEAISHDVIYQEDLDFSLQASNAVKRLGELLNSAENQSIHVQQLIIGFSQAQERSRTSAIMGFTTRLIMDVTSLHRAITMVVANAHAYLNTVDDDVLYVQNTSTRLTTFRSTISNRALSVSAIITKTLPILNLTEVTLDSINSSVMAVQSSVANRSSLVSTASEAELANQLGLGQLNSSLSTLQLKLKQALDAAFMIDIALQFDGNSSLMYPLPNTTSSTVETISLLFNPSNVTSGTLISQDERNQDAVLQFHNGSVSFNYGSGNISAGSGLLQENQWYHIYATKDNTEAILSLTFLPENVSCITVSAPVTTNQNTLFRETAAIGSYYEGCLDKVIINNHLLHLLDPLERDVFNICNPRPPAETDREFGNGAWLYGAGSYIRLSSLPFQLSDLNFNFRTLDSTGLLVFTASTNFTQYVAIYLMEGRLAVDFQLSTVDFLHLRTESFYNTGVWYEVHLLIDQSNLTITVNQTEILSGSSSQVINSALVPLGTIILGGLTADYVVLTETLTTSVSMAGCMEGFQVNGMTMQLNETSESYRVEFSGCPEAVVPGVRFMGNGRAEFSITNQEISNVTIIFRTTQVAAMLLHLDGLSISIFHANLRIALSDTLLVTQELKLNDNVMHTVSLIMLQLTSGNTSLELIVDGDQTAFTVHPRITATADRIFVGGVSPIYTDVSVRESFRGCINSLTINERELFFNDADILINVSLYGCREENQQPQLPPPLPPPIPPPPSLPFSNSVGLSGRNGSFIAIQISQDQVLESFSMTLNFQTVSSNGILLYLQGTVYDDFFLLHLVSGHLVFSYDLGSGYIENVSRSSYNDGMSHTVEIQRSFQAGKLTIDDGVEIIMGVSPGSFSHLNSHSGYLFVGGVPAMMTPLGPLQEYPLPLLACISGFAINGVFEDLTAPAASNGVDQCLSVYNNVARMLRNSYLLMRDEFEIGVELNVSLDFRTDNCSGLLLYVASSIYPDHLLVELRNGCVRLVFDNGPMREELEYCADMQLCDGAWHSLFVSKSGLFGSISVDTDDVQTVLSSCDICQNFRAINTNDPLYVGGIPASLPSRYTVETDSFEGCLSNLYIYREGRDPEGVIFSQALEHDNVVFDTCY